MGQMFKPKNGKCFTADELIALLSNINEGAPFDLNINIAGEIYPVNLKQVEWDLTSITLYPEQDDAPLDDGWSYDLPTVEGCYLMSNNSGEPCRIAIEDMGHGGRQNLHVMMEPGNPDSHEYYALNEINYPAARWKLI